MLVSTAGSLRDIGHIHASAVKIVQRKIQPSQFKWCLVYKATGLRKQKAKNFVIVIYSKLTLKKTKVPKSQLSDASLIANKVKW